MIELAARVVPLKLNSEKEGRELAIKLGVSGLPSIKFVDANVELEDTITGYRDPDAFAPFLKDLYSSAIRKARTELHDKPDDGEANARFAMVSAQSGELEDAESAIDKARKAEFKGDVLGQACNSLGDAYAVKGEIDKAIEAFQRADLSGGEAIVRGYAKLRMMQCYKKKGDDSRAERTAKSLLRLKDAPEPFTAEAKALVGDD